jgi:hypothetical protein
MALHILQYGDTEVFALTFDENGHNLPTRKAYQWRFVETLHPMRFACGDDKFGEAQGYLDVMGFCLFEGGMRAFLQRPSDSLPEWR